MDRDVPAGSTSGKYLLLASYGSAVCVRQLVSALRDVVSVGTFV